jgi:hypothetical protein
LKAIASIVRAFAVSAHPGYDRRHMAVASGVRFSSLILTVLVAAPMSASAAGSVRVSKVEPAAAVSGAAIEVKGKGLKGKSTRVTVGGRTAKVLAARANRLRIVVPRVRAGTHKLVVKRGQSSGSGRLRVLKPFRGKVSVTPDKARRKRREIGPSGGEITATGADGTRYTLKVPAGALAEAEQISVTPVKRFGGLPFGGAALGAELTPNGLTFATPATLTIKSRRPLSKALIGFAYANSSRVLEAQAPSGSRRSRVLQIEHFSTGAVAGSTPADFANAVAPLLVEQPMREDVIERVLDLRAAYEDAFGPDFCDAQPRCGEAMQLGLDSLQTRIQSRCANQTLPALAAVRQIISMESLRQRLGAQDDISFTCREQIMRAVFDPAKLAACGAPDPPAPQQVPGNPLGRHSLIVNTRLDEGAPSDLDGDRELTHLEFIHFLISQVQLAGLKQMAREANNCFFNTMDGLPAKGRTLCETDRDAAEYDLSRALDYAQALGHHLQPFIDALDFCRVEVTMSPTSAVLAPGEQKDFEATPRDVLDPDANGGVTWSATAGTVDANGLYTAPSTAGTYEVRATSSKNSARSATASVVVASDIGLYTGTSTACEGECNPPGPARGLLEKSGDGSFALYLSMDADPPDTARCGSEPGYDCVKLTGTGSGPTYSGQGTFSGQSCPVTATVSGTSMTARCDFGQNVLIDFSLTHDP